ncbi:hypothetical protein [Micromonospora andamanensis]|uniref:hypothetical protein n=1 Tax=Micromonospora andamanensis TaxID=1287068 RepID=UPI00195040D9|nr:hypothetical protein [Micromonospora andamanensis]
MPAVPEHDTGSEVCIQPGTLDLPGFLSLAEKLGGGVLYLKAEPFEPEHDDAAENPPEHLLKHRGNIGRVSVAFAANGIVHFWEQEAPWYYEWQDRENSAYSRFPAPRGNLDDGPERLSGEERARLADELANTLLASPEFRAAKMGARQRVARFAVPPDTHEWVRWDAIREACDRAEVLAQTQYASITDRLDGLAAELLTTPAYQQASSPAARKQVAEQFLISQADGFSPPAHLRDELYARSQRLLKTAKHPPALL